MIERIESLLAEVKAATLNNQPKLEAFKGQFTGKKGVLAELFGQLKEVAPADKGRVGKALNELKQLAEAKVQEAQEQLDAQKKSTPPADLTLPAAPYNLGSRHPIAQVQRKIVDVFTRLGFSIADGPEIEDDWHNFTALNFPPNHPAREMQDTYFLPNPEGKPEPFLLRTHTSSVQVRVMETTQPPIRMIMPGRVYRNETVTARSHCFFHQIEGLHIERGVSFKDMKQTLLFFAQQIFGPNTQIRLRPSYFPFTEISAEMDVTCGVCHGKGCNVCKHSGWVEVLGCGMVDPNVLSNCGIDPEIYSGYAFGLGIERTTMGLFGIPDLRLFSQNDVRFLNQFARIH